MLSKYELQRLSNIERNNGVLAQLGLAPLGLALLARGLALDGGELLRRHGEHLDLDPVELVADDKDALVMRVMMMQLMMMTED